MDTILVLTDFSDVAFHAAQYACVIGRQLGIKRIVLYHTYEIIVPAAPTAIIGQVNYGMEGTYDPAYDRLLMETNLESMEKIKARLTGFAGSDAKIECGTGNTPLAGGINDIIEEYNAGLVVMGITGKDYVGKILIGSNAIRVADAASRPVLIVPQETVTGPVTRIVLACDLQNTPDALPVEGLEDILDGFNAPLMLVNVGHGDAYANANEMANASGLYSQLEKYSPSFDFIDNKDTVAGIMEFAGEQKASLVIAIRKDHGFFKELFQRSVTHQLAYHTSVPLLVVHEAKP
jgi:nucleotide-binding universal stress UspA family protein